jgi:hypothetical protein
MRLTLLGMIAAVAAVILMVVVAGHDWDRALANSNER